MKKGKTSDKKNGGAIVIDEMVISVDNLKKLSDGLNQNPVKIRKAKIKDDLFLDVEFTEDLPGHSKKDTKLSCTVPVHDDLKNSFGALKKHLAILTDNFLMDDEDLKLFTIKGFHIGGNDENEGVILLGNKEGKYGLINLNTPFQKWEEGEYSNINELGSDINTCIYEVEQYLFQGKRAPERQLNLFDNDLENENENEDHG